MSRHGKTARPADREASSTGQPLLAHQPTRDLSHFAEAPIEDEGLTMLASENKRSGKFWMHWLSSPDMK